MSGSINPIGVYLSTTRIDQESKLTESNFKNLKNLDTKIKNLVKQRKKAFFFTGIRFGRKIKALEIKRMQVGTEIVVTDIMEFFKKVILLFS